MKLALGLVLCLLSAQTWGQAKPTASVETGSSGEQFTAPSTNCVKISPLDTNAEGVSFNLQNTCGKAVTVVHCFDRVQGLGGECNKKEPPGNGGSLGEWWGGHQGNGDLAPGSSSKSIYIPSHMYLHVRACELPSLGAWISVQSVADGGRYDCLMLQGAAVSEPRAAPGLNSSSSSGSNEIPAPAAQSIAGTWVGYTTSFFGKQNATLNISSNGGRIDGLYVHPKMGNLPISGTSIGSTINLTCATNDGPMTWSLQVNGSQITGTWRAGMFSGNVQLNRQ